jgi:hypothetical protein
MGFRRPNTTFIEIKTRCRLTEKEELQVAGSVGIMAVAHDDLRKHLQVSS